MKVFCVFDSKAEAFMQPFFMGSIGEATRAWTDLVNDGRSACSRHPADFTLFEIGTWDQLKGVISMHEAKRSLGTGVEFVKSSSDQLSLLKGVANA